MSENQRVPLTEPLDGRVFGEDQACFGCGPKHPMGFQLVFERHEGVVTTRVTPGNNYQGAPGLFHGGLAGLLCDEIAAWAILANTGKFGFTTQMNVSYMAPLRVNTEIVGRGWIVKDARRLMDTAVELSQGGIVAVTAELRFAILDQKGAEKIIGTSLPEEWRRFSR